MALFSEEDIKLWIQDLELKARCRYSIRSTEKCSGQRVRFKQRLFCQFNTRCKTQYEDISKIRTKNTNCPSSLNITLQTIRKVFRGKAHNAPDPEMPCVIDYVVSHNHDLPDDILESDADGGKEGPKIELIILQGPPDSTLENFIQIIDLPGENYENVNENSSENYENMDGSIRDNYIGESCENISEKCESINENSVIISDGCETVSENYENSQNYESLSENYNENNNENYENVNEKYRNIENYDNINENFEQINECYEEINENLILINENCNKMEKIRVKINETCGKVEGNFIVEGAGTFEGKISNHKENSKIDNNKRINNNEIFNNNKLCNKKSHDQIGYVNQIIRGQKLISEMSELFNEYLHQFPLELLPALTQMVEKVKNFKSVKALVSSCKKFGSGIKFYNIVYLF